MLAPVTIVEASVRLCCPALLATKWCYLAGIPIGMIAAGFHSPSAGGVDAPPTDLLAPTPNEMLYVYTHVHVYMYILIVREHTPN